MKKSIFSRYKNRYNTAENNQLGIKQPSLILNIKILIKKFKPNSVVKDGTADIGNAILKYVCFINAVIECSLQWAQIFSGF